MEVNAIHGGIQMAEREQPQFTKGEQGVSGLVDLVSPVCSLSQLSYMQQGTTASVITMIEKRMAKNFIAQKYEDYGNTRLNS
jgi:hypothetical protein